MIFLSGIHGVGKTYFSDKVKEATSISSYSASSLIEQKKQTIFHNDKLISDIDDNQTHLLQAVNELKTIDSNFILDGHFCLLNTAGEVCRVPYHTFTILKPEAIIVLTEDPAIISHRRLKRDGIIVTNQSINEFQQEECTYAKEVALGIDAKLFISKGSSDFSETLEFIRSL